MVHSSVLPLPVFKIAWSGSRSYSQTNSSKGGRKAFRQALKRIYPGFPKSSRSPSSLGELTSWHVSQLPEFMSEQTRKWDDSRLVQASSRLDSLSLATLNCLDGVQGLSMHPLAHAWARDRLAKAMQDQAWVTMGCLLTFLSKHGYDKWQAYENDLRPHIQSFLSVGLGTILSYGPEEVMLPILIRCGWMLIHMREDRTLDALLNHVFLGYGISPTKPSENYILVWDLVGIHLTLTGKTKQAEALFEFIVNIRDSRLPETDGSRLASQHELARVYRENGQIEKAITLLEHVVRIRENTLLEAHPSRLASQHELASACLSTGQIQKAITLLEHVVRIRENTLLEAHPDRLASQHELACAYLSTGQIQKAITLLEHVVRIGENTLLEAHPNRLASQHELACAYSSTGQIQKAITLLEHVVRISENTLLEAHPDRLASQHELACLYRENGQIEKAVTLLEHVVRIRENTLLETHPDRLVSQHELARAYYEKGRIQESVALFEHVVKIRKETLSETHANRIASENWLAKVISETA